MSTATQQAPQHMQALARANRVRQARAELKRSIARGEVSVLGLLAPDRTIPFEAVSMPVAELLTAQHRWGRTRARRLLRQLEISENRPVGDLTARQRGLIVHALEGDSLELAA